MSDIEIMDGAVTTPEPVAPVKPEPIPEPAPETPEGETPEPTPEQVEEHKKQTGSARQKARAERAEREAAELRERVARLEGQAAPKEPVKPIQQGEPHLDAFDSFAEYNAALIEYKVEKKLEAARIQEQGAKAAQSWESKKAEARKELPDFDEALADMETPAPVVVAVMNESEHTAKIAYHLAQHPEELRRINQMSPPAAALAIGRIEAGLEKPKAPTPKPTSKAPPPVKPLAPSAAVVASKSGGMEVGY